jgi:hypothetical protein
MASLGCFGSLAAVEGTGVESDGWKLTVGVRNELDHTFLLPGSLIPPHAFTLTHLPSPLQAVS